MVEKHVRELVLTALACTTILLAAPVVSSCNIPTIPLREAQMLAPRPPSPGEREAAQRAARRDDPNKLTPRDASVLVSEDESPVSGFPTCQQD